MLHKYLAEKIGVLFMDNTWDERGGAVMLPSALTARLFYRVAVEYYSSEVML